MTEVIVTRGPMAPDATWPRINARPITRTGGVTVGEWSMTRAAFTDRHQHVEVNTVLEGELVVECDGATHTLGPGETIAVPAGAKARYCAPEFARMVYVYGPGEPGMTDAAYEEL